MAQQNTGGFGVAHPVPYSPEDSKKSDTSPSEIQPPGVDQEEDIDLETALISL